MTDDDVDAIEENYSLAHFAPRVKDDIHKFAREIEAMVRAEERERCIRAIREAGPINYAYIARYIIAIKALQ